MIENIIAYLFRVLGWKISNVEIGKSVQKAVFAVGPHTSNWDFFLGLAVRKVYGIPTRFLAKESLFRFPLGGVMRWLGGYPVDRRSSHGLVDQVVGIFNREPHFLLTIAPEGTRSKVEEIKSGFYYIARQAKVPIIPVTFDYAKKEVRFYPPIPPDTPKEQVIDKVTALFRQARGKHPEKGM